MLKHGGLPDQRLLQFMAGRCGSTVTNPDANFSVTQVPADVPDAEILEQWRSDLRRDLAEGVEKAPPGARLGIWFGREEDQTFVVTVRGFAQVELDPIRVSDSGSVSLRGVVQTERKPQVVYGLVNQGSHAVAMCDADPRQKLPRFELSCPLAEGDEAAWIEIVARPADRLLSHRVARLLVSRAAWLRNTFE